MTDQGYQAQYNKMTKTPVWKLVVTLAVPSTVSMLITNIYNTADTYFVSSLGVNESGATGVVFSLMAIIQAIGFMIGAGAGSCIARELGAGKIEQAKRTSATLFYVGIGLGVLFAVFGILFNEPLMVLLGSTQRILPPAKQYSLYILIAVPVMVGSFALNNILRYEGKAFYGMIGLGAGGILNIFGDYFLIRHAGMGIAGAGLATCVSQYISFVILILAFVRGKSQVSLNLGYFTPDVKKIAQTIMVGFPSLVRQGLFGLSAAALNHCSAMVGGEAAVAAMSIVSRVCGLMYSVAIGFGQGYQPVAGFNYGAGRYDRVRKAMTFLLFLILGWLVFIGLAGFFNADWVISRFREDPEILRLGAAALKAQCVILPLLTLQITANMTYQSLGFAFQASLLASFRSGLFFIPVVIIVSNLFSETGLILSQPLADLIGTAVTIPFLLAARKKLAEKDQKASSGTGEDSS